MNKKGFTLIELLAVIVILAIIALIATPIVLNIIDDTKEESELRSTEFYLDALELSIAQATLDGKNLKDGNYQILENGNLCLNYEADNTTCKEVLEVEVKGDVPKRGTIYIKNGEINDIAVVLNNKTIVKNDKGELKYKTEGAEEELEKTIDDICELKNASVENKITAGDKYECKVDPDKDPYTFYVLTTPSTTDFYVDLIMDQNINSDGTPAGMTRVTQATNPNQYNTVAWITEENYYEDTGGVIPDEVLNDGGACQYGRLCVFTDKGPVTAMKFLYNATKSWTNVSPLNYEYKDREFQNITLDGTGYTSFISNNGEAVITSLDTSNEPTKIGTKKEPLRARMPIYSATYDENMNKTSEKGEVADKKIDTSNEYLYYNLLTNNVGPYGYWILSSTVYNFEAGAVDNSGVVSSSNTQAGDSLGVRPVINLKI